MAEKKWNIPNRLIRCAVMEFRRRLQGGMTAELTLRCRSRLFSHFIGQFARRQAWMVNFSGQLLVLLLQHLHGAIRLSLLVCSSRGRRPGLGRKRGKDRESREAGGILRL